jgi:hypothetical protein
LVTIGRPIPSSAAISVFFKPRRGQHDTRPLRQRLRARRATRPTLQRPALLAAQLDLLGNRKGHTPTLPNLPPN